MIYITYHSRIITKLSIFPGSQLQIKHPNHLYIRNIRTALQNLDPFSTSGPVEPIQRDETIFNPLAQATAIRESLSQLPGVASSVFSSFSSILKGTAPQEHRVNDSSSQYTETIGSSQYQCFYDQSLIAANAQQNADVQPIIPAFYSPTDPNLVRPESSLSPSSSQESNSYRLKNRKKHYAQIPGLNSNHLNISASVLPSPSPSAAEQIQLKPSSPSFSLTSFFGDKTPSTILPKSGETLNILQQSQSIPAPGFNDPNNSTPFLQQQQQQQPPEQFIPVIQTDTPIGTGFSQPPSAPILYTATTAFNLNPYQHPRAPEIVQPSTQSQNTHLSSQPVPAINSFIESSSPAFTPISEPVARPTTAPPPASGEPSSYRLRGKPLYKTPLQQINSNSSPFVNAPTAVPSALTPNVQTFSPALSGNHSQSIGQFSSHNTQSPIQLFDPAALSAGQQFPQTLLQPLQPSHYSRPQSSEAPPPSQSFNPTTISSQAHFESFDTKFEEAPAPVQTAPTPIQLFNPAALFDQQSTPQAYFQQLESSPKDCRPQIIPEPIQLFNPPVVAEQLPPQIHFNQFKPTFEDLQAPPQNSPPPTQLSERTEQPPSQTNFGPIEERPDEITSPQIFGQVPTLTPALSSIQLFNPAATSPSPPVIQTYSEQFQQTNIEHNQLQSLAAAETASSPFQLFNLNTLDAEHQPQSITPIPNDDTLNSCYQGDTSTVLSEPALALSQSQSQAITSNERRQSLQTPTDQQPTDIVQSPETFQSSVPRVEQEPKQRGSSIFGSVAAAKEDCANFDVDRSSTTSHLDWAAVDSENNNRSNGLIAFETSNVTEATTSSIEPISPFADVNANVEQQNLFNDPPLLSELQKDEQDKNFNIIRTNLLNKRIESITGANRTDNDNTESLSIASVIVEPASSVQSEISECATDATIARSLTEPLQESLAVSVSIVSIACENPNLLCSFVFFSGSMRRTKQMVLTFSILLKAKHRLQKCPLNVPQHHILVHTRTLSIGRFIGIGFTNKLPRPSKYGHRFHSTTPCYLKKSICQKVSRTKQFDLQHP